MWYKKSQLIIWLLAFFALSLSSCTTNQPVTSADTVYAQQYNSESDFLVAPLDGGRSVEITNYVGNRQNVSIPPQIAGMPVTSIGNSAFKEKGITSVIIPNSVTAIGILAFHNCKSLTSITLPNSIATIGSTAFTGCTKLTSITIPASVTSIDRQALFDRCESLTSITVAAANPNYASEGGILYNKTKTELIRAPEGISGTITLPTSVRIINEYAFNDCKSFTSIIIPASVTEIGYQAFSGCEGLTSITVAAANPNYASDNWILYNKSKTVLIKAPARISGTVTIPTSVTTIDNWAFADCKNLASITLPASVTFIGLGAFIYCYRLSSITIPDSVTSIGVWAFDKTAWLYSQPDGLVYAGKVLYTYKGTMPANTIINNIKADTITIAGEAFDRCENLTSVTIPTGVISIGEEAFSFCSNLTGITIPNSVTSIGKEAFYKCTSLTSIIIPASVTFVGREMFGSWTPSQTINIQGKANRVATISAGWDNRWDAYCDAIINYLRQ
jgi:hypothetical protein